MRVVCAPWGIVSAEFPKQGLRDLVTAGFHDVLIDFRCGEAPVEPEGAKPLPGMKAFLAEAGNAGLALPVARAAHLPADRTKLAAKLAPEELSARLEQMTTRAIETAAKHGAKDVIVPPLFHGVARDAFFDENRAYFLRLADVARAAGVRILIVPDERCLSGHFVRGRLTDGRAMAAFVDELNETAGAGRFGACLDMQMAGGCGQDMHAYITALGARLGAVLLTDTDGTARKELLPYTLAEHGGCETDWLAVIRGLRAIRYDGLLVLALGDTAAACPPLLRPTMLTLAKKTGDYLAWQIGMENEIARYDKRVLFGAGRMCRNYLLNYGEAYPPLFTCDNNPKMWGTTVDGLPVKSPEELRKLPPNCAIFICNIYYREIEAQLKDMGLPNPVAYFNDECPQRVVLEKIEVRK